ncbi:MAG: pnuC [Bacteroidota bacterium]|nr:pnuC [Bacteroidota bacterium]
MDTYLQYTAVGLGILNVILAARNNIWCWLPGIIGSAIYVYLNVGWQLYYDMILQFFYILAGFYGWWQWGIKSNAPTRPIISWSFKKQIPLLIGGVVLSLILGCITYYYLHTPITFFDAAVTVFSFIATWMMAKRIIENWLWWIVIDLAAIELYWLKDAPPTSFLYLFLTLGALYAFIHWRSEMQKKLEPNAAE